MAAEFENHAPYSVILSYWVLNWGVTDIDVTLPAQGGRWEYNPEEWRNKDWVLIKSSVIDEGRAIVLKEGENILKGGIPLFTSWVTKHQKLIIDKDGKITVQNK